MSNEPEFKPTHKYIITVSSMDDIPEVVVHSKWSPDTDVEGIKELGYIPQAYVFVMDYLLPALEKAYQESEYADLKTMEAPSGRIN